jgi:hypothetical protein
MIILERSKSKSVNQSLGLISLTNFPQFFLILVSIVRFAACRAEVRLDRNNKIYLNRALGILFSFTICMLRFFSRTIKLLILISNFRHGTLCPLILEARRISILGQNYRNKCCETIETFPSDILTTDYVYECVSKEVRVGGIQYLQRIKWLNHLKNILESISYLLIIASNTSFTEWFSKPWRGPTHICLPCCAILACSEVGT